MFTKKHARIVESEIKKTSAFLDIPTSESYVRFPPPIDDFDGSRRITWVAKNDKGKLVGGGLVYNTFGEHPDKDNLTRRTRRTAAFALLVENHPAYDFINEAILAHRTPTSNLPDVMTTEEPHGEHDLLGRIIAIRAIRLLNETAPGKTPISAKKAIDHIVKDAVESAVREVEKARAKMLLDRNE